VRETEETMNVRYEFEMVAALANEVARYRKEGQTAFQAVETVLFMYEWNLRGVVQAEIERRERY
jgi:hypothetical protein